MNYFSAFSGVGGFDMAVPEDWECVGMSEIDKYANMVLKYHFKKVKNYGDIEKIRYEELPDFDVLLGGSPCQDLSVAGKREGLAGLRSRLFFSYAAILKVKKPEYFIFENVKGLLSSNGGWDFARVLLEFQEAGYDVWWQVLDATDFGIPQHRERVFVFGTIRGKPLPKIFFERKDKGKDSVIQKQRGNTLTSRYHKSEANGSYIIEGKQKIENLHNSKRQIDRIYGINGVAPTLHRKTGGRQEIKIAMPVRQADGRGENAHGRRIKNADEPSFTLQSSQRHGVMVDDDIRYLTPLESERLMGWEDNWTKYGMNEKDDVVEISDSQRYNLIGNGVVPWVVQNIIEKFMEVEK